jgi:hypothetical protein
MGGGLWSGLFGVNRVPGPVPLSHSSSGNAGWHFMHKYEALHIDHCQQLGKNDFLAKDYVELFSDSLKPRDFGSVNFLDAEVAFNVYLFPAPEGQEEPNYGIIGIMLLISHQQV